MKLNVIQTGNQKPKFEGEQTMLWSREKGKKRPPPTTNKQWSTTDSTEH